MIQQDVECQHQRQHAYLPQPPQQNPRHLTSHQRKNQRVLQRGAEFQHQHQRHQITSNPLPNPLRIISHLLRNPLLNLRQNPLQTMFHQPCILRPTTSLQQQNPRKLMSLQRLNLRLTMPVQHQNLRVGQQSVMLLPRSFRFSSRGAQVTRTQSRRLKQCMNTSPSMHFYILTRRI